MKHYLVMAAVALLAVWASNNVAAVKGIVGPRG